MNSPTTAKLTDKLAAWCNRTQFQLTVKVIYPKYYKVGFPTGQDSATFWDNRTEVPSLSWDKKTTGQSKNLAKGRVGPGQSKVGTGRAEIAKIGTRDKTEQSRKGRSKTGK